MCPGISQTANCSWESSGAKSLGSWTEPYFFCDQYTNDTVQSPAMKRSRHPSEQCAFARVRPGTDESDPGSRRAQQAALKRLQRAREVQLCGKTLYPTQKDRQQRVESFVNRAYFRLDAMNQATRLRRQRDAGDALRTDAPVNTALFRFGDLLRDLGPQMHLVRRNVVEALR